MIEFDDVLFEEYRGTVFLTVMYGVYSKSFNGFSKADCINQLLQWVVSRNIQRRSENTNRTGRRWRYN